jgi:hypothetical protein
LMPDTMTVFWPVQKYVKFVLQSWSKFYDLYGILHLKRSEETVIEWFQSGTAFADDVHLLGENWSTVKRSWLVLVWTNFPHASYN